MAEGGNCFSMGSAMDTLETIWDVIRRSPEVFSVAGAILLATIGYIAKHVSDLRIQQYEGRLAFVTSQLRDLYGPLFLLSQSNDKTWRDFRQTFRPNRRMFDKDDPLSRHEKAEYVRWLETAFLPCNAKMRRVIENNARLFEHGRAPGVVLELLSHFDDLNVVLSKLKDGSDDNVFPSAPYPKDFAAFVERDYNSVVQSYSKLISKRR